MCLGVLHYISLYALILHSTLAHHWVPFSLGVSQNKRTSVSQSNKYGSFGFKGCLLFFEIVGEITEILQYTSIFW